MLLSRQVSQTENGTKKKSHCIVHYKRAQKAQHEITTLAEPHGHKVGF